MSFHPTSVLDNQDILYSIFEYFAAPETAWYDFDIVTRKAKSANDPEEAVRRRTLASCARVCREFLFPAMTVLWRDLDSLDPLAALAKRDRQSVEVGRTKVQ